MNPAPPPADSDDALMIRLQSGDVGAFDELVLRYRGPLVGFFVCNRKDRHLAEDLAQDTLLKLYHQAWDYLPLGRFKGWLFRMARNLMIDSIRRGTHDVLLHARGGRTNEEWDPLALLADDILPPDEVVAGSELKNLIDQLLSDLPDDQRETFTLHHFSGLALPEVAEIMESNVSTTKSRLRLAREKLRGLLLERGIGVEVP